jgi:TetR/AcrR family transcriptional regulator, transcriptional repressor for nem operon
MPRNGTATRDRILDNAQRLALDKGFAATSVDEVIAASSSSKGAFFHHFPSKNDLGRALLSRYAEADVAALTAFMERAEAITDDPGEQVLAFLRLFEEVGDDIVEEQQSSCLYVSFVHDRQLTADGSTQVINDAIGAWRRRLAEKLATAALTRPGLAQLDLEALADHVFVTFEGAFILARASADPTAMRSQLRVLRQLLDALLGQQTRTG